MKITVLEKVPFSDKQKERLSSLVGNNGEVNFCEYCEDIKANIVCEQIRDSDVVVVNWIDPSPFIMSLKPNTLVSLLSTGYGWIQHLSEARDKGVLVSNIPAYSTEAVAEHIIGLLLAYSKKIMLSSNWSRTVNSTSIVGSELKGKTLGIIGLGNIGNRVAEIANALGMDIVTYNRTKKNRLGCEDVSLNKLLSDSDIICVSCPLNEQSKGLINASNIKLAKKNVVFTGATWGVIDEKALLNSIKSGNIGGVAFDLALEGAEKLNNKVLLDFPNFLCTFHNAYNTYEAEKRQMDICIDNIEAFINGTPKNIVN